MRFQPAISPLVGTDRTIIGLRGRLATHDPDFRWRAIGVAIALLLAITAALGDFGAGLDSQLRVVRDGSHVRQASGQIVLVEIDSQSLAKIGQWPWPRRLHAGLVDRLRAANPSQIAFDVDFSARNTPTDDAAFAAALERAGGSVMLPTFGQSQSSNSSKSLENLPIPMLREHAFLASVNVKTDPDGQLRNYSYGTVTDGVPRPSIGAILADVPGQVGREFRIDTAIDPASVPRVSVIDVLSGRTPASVLRGKRLLIGATAIEMGDRYVVPGHQVLPGALVQILAAETLIQGSAVPDLGPYLPLLLAILAIGAGLLNIAPSGRSTLRIVAAVTIAALPLVLEIGKIATVQVVAAFVLLAFDAIWVGVLSIQRTLRQSRFTDAETGLPNARALERRVVAGEGVIVLRLTQFDEMVAVLGAGDRQSLMQHVLARLALGFPVAQFHAVERGVLGWTTEAGAVDALIEQIEGASALFRAPVKVSDRSLLVTPAFGIVPKANGEAARAIAHANLSARHAQDTGQRWALHSDVAATATERSLMLLADLDGAIERSDIHVVFQPKWAFSERRIAGAEALVRWRHPQLGPVGPDEFIPLLEGAGQMRVLTLAIIDTCVAQLDDWQRRKLDLSVAINISAALLNDTDFVSALQAVLDTRPDLARRMTLEVTESATLTGAENAITVLARFRASGAKISIDDYGTGHATLSYLRTFPADEIKIDKSFVSRMLDSTSDQILVRSTIELAHELGFKVVAEGVEDEACLSRLADYGCDIAQGWVIGKPMSPIDFLARLDAPDLAAAA